MSLNELIHRFTPERTSNEKRAILEAMAPCLPAPEFLWLPVALEALEDGETSVRLAALPLLAHSPQHWDTLVVAGLTTGEAAFQAEVIAALAAMASHAPHLQEAFGAIGALPGWLPEAIAAWEEAWGAMRGAPPASPLMSEALEAMRAQLAAAEADRERARTEAEAARIALEAERSEAKAREAALEAETQKLLDEAAEREAELDGRLVIFQELSDKHQRAFEALATSHRKAMGVAAAAAVLALVALPGGWALGSHSAMRAEVPPVVAPTPVPVASEAPFIEALREAEDEGYAVALKGLADRANFLKTKGEHQAAIATWQAYAGLARTPAEAQLAKQELTLLAPLAKAKAPAKPVSRPAQARQVEPSRAARPAAAAPMAKSLPTPPKPPRVEAPIEEAIPDHIRSKF